MEWRLFDKEGNYLQDVSCQYDASDIAVMLYGAVKVELDFDTKEAKILR